MNILYLLKTLKTNKLSELAAIIDAPTLDMNLAIWEAIDRGEIELDEDKDRVTALKDADTWHDPELANKLIRVIQHYSRQETNITRGRLQSYMNNPRRGYGYPVHEYLMTLQHLIDVGQVVEEVISVPGVRKVRPPHTFVFLGLPENEEQNAEWNAKAVNKWIDDFEKTKVK